MPTVAAAKVFAWFPPCISQPLTFRAKICPKFFDLCASTVYKVPINGNCLSSHYKLQSDSINISVAFIIKIGLLCLAHSRLDRV